MDEAFPGKVVGAMVAATLVQICQFVLNLRCHSVRGVGTSACSNARADQEHRQVSAQQVELEHTGQAVVFPVVGVGSSRHARTSPTGSDT